TLSRAALILPPLSPRCRARTAFGQGPCRPGVLPCKLQKTRLAADELQAAISEEGKDVRLRYGTRGKKARGVRYKPEPTPPFFAQRDLPVRDAARPVSLTTIMEQPTALLAAKAHVDRLRRRRT
ncbi:MAG: hypothetical protein BJ554DRAFT_979, partial [Olpidium bornovanus]